MRGTLHKSKKNKNRVKEKQKGGILIQGANQEDAFNYFLQNSTFQYLSRGAFGLTIKANLKPGIVSKYRRLEPTGTSDYGDEVRTLIIKFGFVHDDTKGQTESQVVIDTDLVFSTGELQTFKDEVNIQTDIFLKTMNYLQPICPAIVYSNVYNHENGIDHLLELVVRGSIDTQTKQIIEKIQLLNQEKTFHNIGVIGMEFADSCTLLYYLLNKPNNQLYVNMTLYILLQLAIQTGYTHGDFHTGNIFINTTSNNYFKGMIGRPVLIDFGQAQKIPILILRDIKNNYNAGKYTDALKLLCNIPRPDGLVMQEYPSFYGFACGTYDAILNRPIRKFHPETNKEIYKLILSRDQAITDMVETFKVKHDSMPNEYPLLPLSNAVKNSMYSGLITNGGSKRIRKSKRKNHKRTK